MTILEALRRVDKLRHNTFPQEDKIRWLSHVDTVINRELMHTHEDPQVQDFQPYDVQTPLDQELLVCEPYDEVYMHYLCAMIDFYRGEYERYTRTLNMYHAAMNGFVAYYNRTHLPKGQGFRYF
jgi:hypothetical protein